MPFGPLEIVIVVLVLALLFGASRIPELARTAGRGVREVKEPLRETRSLLSLEDPRTDGDERTRPPVHEHPPPAAQEPPR